MFFVPPCLVLKTFFLSQDFTKKKEYEHTPPHFRLHHRLLLNDDSHLQHISTPTPDHRHHSTTSPPKNIIINKMKTTTSSAANRVPYLENLNIRTTGESISNNNNKNNNNNIICWGRLGNPTRTPEFVVNFYSWSNNTIMQFLLRQNHLVLWAPQKSGFDSQGRLQNSSLHAAEILISIFK